MSRINKKLEKEQLAYLELCERAKNLNDVIVVSFVIDVAKQDDDNAVLAFGFAIKSPDDSYKPRVAKAVAYNRLKKAPCYTTIEKDVYTFFKNFERGEYFLLLKCLERIVVENYHENLNQYDVEYPHPTKKVNGKTIDNAMRLCYYTGKDIIADLQSVYEFSLDDIEAGGENWLN